MIVSKALTLRKSAGQTIRGSPGDGSSALLTVDNPAGWLHGEDAELLGTTEALKLSAVYGAVDYVCNFISALPVYVYDRDKRVRVPTHPLMQVLALRPNEAQTPADYKRMMTRHLELRGISKDIRHWDIAPSQEYFDELARVSENQIIWGGNYFALPPTRCFLVWRKLTISENFTMAMAEYAWTSFNDNAKVFECAPQGTSKWQRIHPCEKPVALYAWIYSRYAKPGDRILDTHLGSGSSRIAAWDAGLDFVGVELDKTYFDLEEKRFAEYSAQLRMEDL